MVIDRNRPPYQARVDQKMAELRQAVNDTGCVIVPIIDGDFAYTVGLTLRGHPELLAYGPPGHVANFLERVATTFLDTGARVEPPSMVFRISETESHTLTVRGHSYLKGDPVLGMVVGLYGPGKTALVIDIDSCRCPQCAAEVLARNNV